MVGDPPNSKRSVPNASKSIYDAYIFCKRVRSTVLSRGVSSLDLARLQSAQYNLFHPMRVSRGLARTQKCFCKTSKCAAAERTGSFGDSPEVLPFLRKFCCLSGSFGHFSCNGQFLGAGYKQPFFHLLTAAADIYFDQLSAKRLECLTPSIPRDFQVLVSE